MELLTKLHHMLTNNNIGNVLTTRDESTPYIAVRRETITVTVDTYTFAERTVMSLVVFDRINSRILDVGKEYTVESALAFIRDWINK